MNIFKSGEREYLTSPLFSKTKLISHGFTSSVGGVSYGHIKGFNLGFRVNDDPSSVIENYKLLARDLELDINRFVLAKQTHTDNIRIVTEADAGKGVTKQSDIEDTDGLVTNIKGLSLVVFSADCVPILMLDPIKGVVSAVHSGWRGTVKGISKKAIDIMKGEFGSSPKDILVAVGPSIGPCCFEFSKVDAHIFPEKYQKDIGDNKVLIDLWNMNKDILLDAGILEKNMDMSDVCTVCNSDKYYSYRTHRDKTGRQGAVIMLK